METRGFRALPFFAILIAFACLSACTPEPPAQKDRPAVPPPAQSVIGKMRVVDLEGRPLVGMAPIATRKPNAFDQPVATGALTDARGESSIEFSAGERLYLRAWDPELAYFPNNFYDALPGAGQIAEAMTVTMAAAATLSLGLLDADGRPIADEAVGLMMIHPSRGPWWPADGRSDGAGMVHFGRVPPGLFSLRLKTEGSGVLEIPEIALAPGTAVDLGPQVLL